MSMRSEEEIRQKLQELYPIPIAWDKVPTWFLLEHSRAMCGNLAKAEVLEWVLGERKEL